MSTPTDAEFAELLGDLLERILDLRYDYSAVSRIAYGRRGAASADRITGTKSELTSVEARAEKSKSKGKCRRAAHLVREAVDKLDEAGRALGDVLGADEALTTDHSVGRRTITEQDYLAARRKRRVRERDPNPLTREKRWGDV